MHHVKPTSKGDPLCPLGFHPQVRWPTRCKRCFRDYKEHGNRGKESDSQLRKDELTVSTPALSSTSQRNRLENRIPEDTLGSRNWTSSSNLSSTGISNKNEDSYSNFSSNRLGTSSSSWTSTPNLAEGKDEVSVSITLPRRRSKPPDEVKEEENTSSAYVRRRTKPLDTGQDDDDPARTYFTVRRRTSPSLGLSNNYSNEPSDSKTSSNTSSTRTRNQQDNERPKDLDLNLSVKLPIKKPSPTKEVQKITTKGKTLIVSTEDTSSEDDSSMVSTYSTASKKKMNEKDYKLQIDQLKKELEGMKSRCEKAEREKSDILMRRLDSATSRSSSSSEVVKLQQKLNELRNTVEDLQVEKKSLTQKLRDMQVEVEGGRGSGYKRENEALKEKLKASERMCEELMETNEDLKREVKDMEDEMDEMQDKFREDRADEYTMLKKELDQATKNCRILSFKLRKAERKAEQLEVEKFEAEQRCREVAGGQAGLDKAERIKQLEHDLSVANETASRLQKELEEARNKTSEKDKGTPAKKKPPKLGSLGKTPSTERVSRESLTRGDSQEDPVQLLRDLQDSLEREADLREQLRFAEEEAENLRKKSARVEDDNESLVLQLKKMASKARTRRHSPSQQRLTPEPLDKDEGISDENDPSELRILLELNEQEAAVLRRKVEELECEGDLLKKKVKDLQEKLSSKTNEASKRSQIQQAEPKKSNAIYEQKLKVVEEEMSELRKKLIEKERECERLHAEVSIGTKKPKTLQKSKSLDTDQQAVDLKRQLQVVETEVNILRTKIQNLETENEKLQSENKKLSLIASKRSGSIERNADSKNIALLEKQLEESNKKIKELEEKTSSNTPTSKSATGTSGEVEKLKTLLKKAETEKKKYEEALQRLRDAALPDAVKFYKNRTPKKPTDLTTKLQMKKMVDDLENEIGDILVLLKKSAEMKDQPSDSSSLKDELNEAKEKFEKLIQEAKEDCKKKDEDIEKLNKMIEDLEKDKLKIMRERDNSKTKFEKEIENLKEVKHKLEIQKNDALKEIDKLKDDLKSSSALQKELEEMRKQAEGLKKDLNNEKKISSELKNKLESSAKTSSDNTKLQKEIEESKEKVESLESKLSDVEEKLRKSEKLATAKKDKVTKLEKEYTELNRKYTLLERENESILIAKQDIKTKFEDAETRIKKLETELDRKQLEIKKLEVTVRSKEKAAKNSSNENQLKEELNTTSMKLKEVTEKLEKAQGELEEKERLLMKKEKELTKEIEEWERKASDLEMDLQASGGADMANRKMMERQKNTHESELKSKDIEISQLKQGVLSAGQKKMSEIKQELQDKIDSLEIALESEKHEYDELTKRYEELEEEHVVMKATLVKEKEKVQSQLVKAANELEDIETELRSLKESYSHKQDYWIKEKHRLEEKAKDYDTLNLEKSKLQAICQEKQSELEQMKREGDCLGEQMNYLKKENEDLKSKLEDYEKLDRVQRNVSGDTSGLERELKEYKSRLASEEKSRKKEMASLKMKYENRLTLISEEILNMQSQMQRFKKERDSYKNLLEAARRNIADLKASGHSMSRSSIDESEWRSQVASLEQQVGSLEDELSEAKMESSKLKRELFSERSNWELKVSELTSRLNELEEEKILSSGRTRVSGTKTRMELAWQKEREEQHRLLHETSTLARDLRQTLFEVERERDRERLEAKRKLDQLKKSSEEEQEEIRKKLNEMQCDLLELRDAHAKLRTTNEKLRREKDRFERDRDLLKQSINIKKKIEQEEERQIISVAQLVEELTVLAPDLFPSKPRPPVTMPTPPVRRKGPKSREASPALERKDYSRESSVGREDAKSQEVQEILRRLTEAANELKKVQQEDRVTFRKAFGSFRSSSIESDGGVEVNKSVKRRGLQRKPSLLRKSLSLEQTTGQEQQVWTDDDQEGSMSSIQSLEESERIRQALHLRDMSLDSRLSGGSTQSEIVPHEKKKKLGLFGKLKKLTKSRSIDQDSDIGSTHQLDPGSDSSLNTADDRVSGKPFKDKLSGMFKKSGSTSRGNSVERSIKASTPVSDSTQRPLVSGGTSGSGDSSSRPLARKPPATAPVQRKAMKK